MTNIETPEASAKKSRTGEMIVLAVTLLSVILLVGGLSIAAAFLIEDGEHAAPIIAALLAVVGLSLPSLVQSLVATQTAARVEKTHQALTNGVMDRKIRAGVHNALDEREHPENVRAMRDRDDG